MKKSLLILLIAMLNTALFAQIKVGIEMGDTAPNIVENNVNGEQISLESLRGKLVLVDFGASYCGQCRLKHKLLVPIYDTYKDSVFVDGSGFEVFGVSLDGNT